MAVKPIVTKNGNIWEGPVRVLKQEAAACCHAVCVSVSGIQVRRPSSGLATHGPGLAVPPAAEAKAARCSKTLAGALRRS
jgi:hypothetical protein